MLVRILTLVRLIANAAACALVVSLLLAGLLLILNPEIAPDLTGVLGASATLTLAYGLPIVIGLPLAFTGIRFFAARPLRIGWFHLKSAVWFLVAGVGAAAGVYTFNLVRAGSLIGGRGRVRLATALGLMASAWILATILAATAQWRREEGSDRRRRAAFCLLAGTPTLVFLTVWAGGARAADVPSATPEVVSRSGPVVLVGIEGATFSEILPLVSDGRLPHLSRLLKEGSHGSLRTVRPCRSSVAWASLSTGMLPSRHGLRDVRIHTLSGLEGELRLVPGGIFFRQWLAPRLLRGRDVSGEDLRARPMWSILDALRVEGSFVRWPLAGARRPGGFEADSVDRSARAKEWIRKIRGAAASPPADLDGAVREAVTIDLGVHEALMRILSSSRPRLLAAWLPGLGSVGAHFMRYRHPEAFGDVVEQEVEAYGRVLPRYYEMLDAFIGEIRAALPADGYMMIVSAYGTEPTGALDRFTRYLAGLPALSGGHDSGPVGVLVLAGSGAAAGRQVDDVRVTDVVPLTLYLLGLPVGRDMDGRLPKRLFERDFLEANPITFIPTYR